MYRPGNHEVTNLFLVENFGCIVYRIESYFYPPDYIKLLKFELIFFPVKSNICFYYD